MAFKAGQSGNPNGRPREKNFEDTPQELRVILKKLKAAAPKGIQHLINSMERKDKETGEVIPDLKIAEKIFTMYLQAMAAQDKILARVEVKDPTDTETKQPPTKRAQVNLTVVQNKTA